jgi:hypothetical protein
VKVRMKEKGGKATRDAEDAELEALVAEKERQTAAARRRAAADGVASAYLEMKRVAASRRRPSRQASKEQPLTVDAHLVIVHPRDSADGGRASPRAADGTNPNGFAGLDNKPQLPLPSPSFQVSCPAYTISDDYETHLNSSCHFDCPETYMRGRLPRSIEWWEPE